MPALSLGGLESAAAAGPLSGPYGQGHGNLPGSKITRRESAAYNREADNESLSLLRSQHENKHPRVAKMVKYSQWQDAQKSTQALKLPLAIAVQRYFLLPEVVGP